MIRIFSNQICKRRPQCCIFVRIASQSILSLSLLLTGNIDAVSGGHRRRLLAADQVNAKDPQCGNDQSNCRRPVTQSAVEMGIYLSIIFIVISALMEVAAVALAPLLRLVRLPVATINAIRSIVMSAQIDAVAMSAADSKATLDEMDRDTIALDARLRALELDRPPGSGGPVAGGGGVLADGAL